MSLVKWHFEHQKDFETPLKGSIIRHTLDSRQQPLSVESHILSNGKCDIDIDRCIDCLKILSRSLLGFSNYLYKCHASSLSSSLRLLHFLRFLHSWLQNDWAVTLSAAAPHYKEHSAKQRTLHITHYCTVHVALQGLECKLSSASCSHTHTHTRQFQLCAFNCWKLALPLLKSQRATQVSDPSCNVFFNTRKCKDMALNLPFLCSQITLWDCLIVECA